MALSFHEQLALTLIDKLVIGVLLATAGLLFNRMLETFKADQAKTLEALKSDLTANLETRRERRASIAEFAKRISAGYHAMEWLTWWAQYDATTFSIEAIDDYNKEMKQLFPEMCAASVMANALNKNSTLATSNISDKLFDLDHKLAQLCVDYANASASDEKSVALAKIGAMHAKLINQDKAFVSEISSVINSPAL